MRSAPAPACSRVDEAVFPCLVRRSRVRPSWLASAHRCLRVRIEQQPHDDEIMIDAIDENGVPLASLDLEANLAIKPQGAGIVVPDRKFHAGQAERVRRCQCLEHQYLAEPTSPVFWQQPHPQYAAMAHGG